MKIKPQYHFFGTLSKYIVSPVQIKYEVSCYTSIDPGFHSLRTGYRGVHCTPLLFVAPVLITYVFLLRVFIIPSGYYMVVSVGSCLSLLCLRKRAHFYRTMHFSITAETLVKIIVNRPHLV